MLSPLGILHESFHKDTHSLGTNHNTKTPIIVVALHNNNNERKNNLHETKDSSGQDVYESETLTSNKSSSISSKYYLLTPTVWKTVLYYTTVLFILDKLALPRLPPSSFIRQVHCSSLKVLPVLNSPVMKQILLPLFASSCCVIQLFINLVSGIGCMGFNTLLGPVRPFFVSILLFTTISSISVKKYTFLVVSWIITLMPEIVHFINNGFSFRKEGQNVRKISKSMEGSSMQIKYIFKVNNMGCVACINKIESTIKKKFPQSIHHMNSSLYVEEKGGEVEIILSSVEEKKKELVSNGIMNVIQESGFECELNAILPIHTKNQQNQ